MEEIKESTATKKICRVISNMQKVKETKTKKQQQEQQQPPPKKTRAYRGQQKDRVVTQCWS